VFVSRALVVRGEGATGADGGWCRFNIWNTGPDPNFDRIVHLAKLVFNTKMVGISLMDGTEECAAFPFLTQNCRARMSLTRFVAGGSSRKV
jgi:hypothetical protein